MAMEGLRELSVTTVPGGQRAARVTSPEQDHWSRAPEKAPWEGQARGAPSCTLRAATRKQTPRTEQLRPEGAEPPANREVSRKRPWPQAQPSVPGLLQPRGPLCPQEGDLGSARGPSLANADTRQGPQGTPSSPSSLTLVSAGHVSGSPAPGTLVPASRAQLLTQASILPAEHPEPRWPLHPSPAPREESGSSCYVRIPA